MYLKRSKLVVLCEVENRIVPYARKFVKQRPAVFVLIQFTILHPAQMADLSNLLVLNDPVRGIFASLQSNQSVSTRVI